MLSLVYVWLGSKISDHLGSQDLPLIFEELLGDGSELEFLPIMETASQMAWRRSLHHREDFIRDDHVAPSSLGIISFTGSSLTKMLQQAESRKKTTVFGCKSDPERFGVVGGLTRI